MESKRHDNRDWLDAVGSWPFLYSVGLGVGLLLCGLLAACDDKPPPATSPVWIAPLPAEWSYYNSTSSEPHYIVRAAPKQISGNVSLTYTVAGNGQLVAVDGGSPPTVSLIIWRNNDNLSCQGEYQQYRYFGHPRGTLSPGTYTLTIPIEPSTWTDCYGKPGTDFPDRFKGAINDVYRVGIGFGGNSAGHGVRAPQGGVVFKLENFSVGSP